MLSGRKLLAYDAPSAGRLIVSAMLDGEPALFVVDAGAAGVVQRAYPLIDGRYAADVDFDDVQLDGASLLCSGTHAREVLEEAIDRLRVFDRSTVLQVCSNARRPEGMATDSFGRDIHGARPPLNHS